MNIRMWPAFVGGLFSRAGARVKRIFKSLPPPREWAERGVEFGEAVLRAGNRLEALEPQHIRLFAYLDVAVRVAQRTAGKGAGADKLAAVRLALEAGYAAVQVADLTFDAAWARLGVPFVEDLVALMKGRDPDTIARPAPAVSP